MFVLEQATIAAAIKVGIGSKMASTASAHLNLTAVGQYLGLLANIRNMEASKAPKYVYMERSMYSQLEASLSAVHSQHLELVLSR